MDKSILAVNEIFGPTVQGEGKSAGKPVVFLRLSLCNLSCIWCDTPHTWNWTGSKFKHPEKFDKSKEVHKMSIMEVIEQIKSKTDGTIKSLVISGGEPLLQQPALIELLKILKAEGWWAEVETNGTMAPITDFVQLIDQINCSPKLANSEDSLGRRFKPLALESLARCSKVNFKFVISKEEDMMDVIDYVDFIRCFGNPEIRLMPLCITKEELESREQMVKELCSKYDFIYTTRLSILMAGNERGV